MYLICITNKKNRLNEELSDETTVHAVADYSVKTDCCVMNVTNNNPGPAKTSDTQFYI